MSKKLFVGNLPFEVNDSDLSTVIAVAGTVASAKIVINKKTGRSKGYGFVEMATEEAAETAVKKFEGATLNERPLTVQLATPKQEAQATSDEAGTSEGGGGAVITPNTTPHASASQASTTDAPSETPSEGTAST
jgi:RNA recognition motif-containing protein